VSPGIAEAIGHLLTHCGSLQSRESVLILCEPATVSLADDFLAEAGCIAESARRVVIPETTHHGQEPPAAAAEAMGKADLVVCLCRFSLAHSRARIDAATLGARFLSLPFYTRELLESPAMALDFKSRGPVVRRVADIFSQGSSIHVESASGTDLTLDAAGRIGNCCPGFVESPGDLGSPPDVEANIAPREELSYGIAVIDGSVTCPEIGLLETAIKLTIEAGRIRAIESRNRDYVEILERLLQEPASKRRVLAECGVGLNPAAGLTGNMLTDEGAEGCVHFGFGSNHTVGGRNEVDFHLDFVLRDGSIRVDGRELFRSGELVA
jgi:leucyl aminopeptidase (aminopeptidase T)